MKKRLKHIIVLFFTQVMIMSLLGISAYAEKGNNAVEERISKTVSSAERKEMVQGTTVDGGIVISEDAESSSSCHLLEKDYEKYVEDGTLQERIDYMETVQASCYQSTAILNDKTNFAERYEINSDSSAKGWMPHKGTVKGLVLLVDFPECGYSELEEYSPDNLLKNNFSQLSIFSTWSYGKFNLSVDVSPWYVAQHDRDYYKNTGINTLFEEVVSAFDEKYDYSNYDINNDNYIDGLYICFAGDTTGWGSTWWSYVTSYGTDNGEFVKDGMSFGQYAFIAANSNSILHETGHLLLLPDLYSYQFANSSESYILRNDLMVDNSHYLNPFNKLMLGWIDEPVVVNSLTDLTTIELHESRESMDIAIFYPNGDINSEFIFVADYISEFGLRIFRVNTRWETEGVSYHFSNKGTYPEFINTVFESDKLMVSKKTGLSEGDEFGVHTCPSSFIPADGDSYQGPFVSSGLSIFNIINKENSMVFDVSCKKNTEGFEFPDSDIEVVSNEKMVRVSIAFESEIYIRDNSRLPYLTDGINTDSGTVYYFSSMKNLLQIVSSSAELVASDDLMLVIPEGYLGGIDGSYNARIEYSVNQSRVNTGSFLIDIPRFTTASDIKINTAGDVEKLSNGDGRLVGIRRSNGAFELYIDTISKGNVEQSVVKCDFLAQYDDIACVHGSYVDSKDNYYLWINMTGKNSSFFILQISKDKQVKNIMSSEFSFYEGSFIEYKNGILLSPGSEDGYLMYFDFSNDGIEEKIYYSDALSEYFPTGKIRAQEAGDNILFTIGYESEQRILFTDKEFHILSEFCAESLFGNEYYWYVVENCIYENNEYIIFMNSYKECRQGQETGPTMAVYFNNNFQPVKKIDITGRCGEVEAFENGFIVSSFVTRINLTSSGYLCHHDDVGYICDKDWNLLYEYVPIVDSDIIIGDAKVITYLDGQFLFRHFDTISAIDAEGIDDPQYKKKVASGVCGENLTWKLTEDGVLTISGSGTMQNYTYKSEMPWYSHINEITTAVIEDGVTTIGDYAFYGMPELTSVKIPAGVTTIGAYAFKNSTVLDGVVLPDTLKKIGESAFYGCSGLSEITIPEGIYTVWAYTFKNCTSLTSVSLPSTLIKIDVAAFYGCIALTELTIPDNVSIIGSYCFKNCTSLASVDLSSSLTQIREATFYGSVLTSLEIHEGVTQIAPYAFKNCTSLKTLSLPESLTSIGEAAFYSCAMTNLEIPDAVTSIGSYAFKNCTSLESVDLSERLTEISESCFYNCTSLVLANIPEGVTAIEGYAFKNCTGLVELILPTSLNTIGASSFCYCTGLIEITIPENVISLGEYAFSRCTGLRTIEFLGDAPAIGIGGFSSVTSTNYYPTGNGTWTDDVMQNYGGTLTWIPKD